MAQSNQTLGDDIAFMRDLAEAGRDKPMIGGSILLASGLIFGSASLLVWYLAAVQGLGGWMYTVVWIPTALVFYAVLFWLLRSIPRAATTAQAAAGMAWSAAGCAIVFIGISLGLVAYRLQAGEVMMVFPSILVTLYGAAWLVGGALLRQQWQRLVGFASFGVALVNAWFANSDLVWLVYAISLFGLLAAPGAVIMRQARAAG
jgi:hypothetical protein